MLATKNITPRQLSAYTALALSFPIALVIYLLNHNWLEAILSLAGIFFLSFTLILFIFQKFIYRKLKLIYKFIYQTKASKQQETHYKYVLPQKSIDEVHEDVEAWANQKSREIELLKKNETFRREFLQNLSHEFKTPVFAIQGYIETLLDGAVEDPQVNKRFLTKTANNVQRLVNLLHDLDEISELERGEVKLDKQTFVIQELIHEVFESLSIKAEKQNISFNFKKGCEQPLRVFADREKIRQVLINLIDNSIKYGKAGSSIVASMYDIDDKTILVEMSDEGIGIAEKNLSRIFERFYRTQEGRNRDATGTGLGLAICKHIIEAHGHSIHVRSKENFGTTIGFTLDAANDQ